MAAVSTLIFLAAVRFKKNLRPGEKCVSIWCYNCEKKDSKRKIACKDKWIFNLVSKSQEPIIGNQTIFWKSPFILFWDWQSTDILGVKIRKFDFLPMASPQQQSAWMTQTKQGCFLDVGYNLFQHLSAFIRSSSFSPALFICPSVCPSASVYGP